MINQCVNIKVKVVEICKLETITNSKDGHKLNKTNVIIADRSATSHIVLWESKVDQLELHQSYCIVSSPIIATHILSPFITILNNYKQAGFWQLLSMLITIYITHVSLLELLILFRILREAFKAFVNILSPSLTVTKFRRRW